MHVCRAVPQDPYKCVRFFALRTAPIALQTAVGYPPTAIGCSPTARLALAGTSSFCFPLWRTARTFRSQQAQAKSPGCSARFFLMVANGGGVLGVGVWLHS